MLRRGVEMLVFRKILRTYLMDSQPLNKFWIQNLLYLQKFETKHRITRLEDAIQHPVMFHVHFQSAAKCSFLMWLLLLLKLYLVFHIYLDDVI